MSPAPNPRTCTTTVDRRCYCRFPIHARAGYLSEGQRGEVIVSDISNSGMLVQSTEILPAGALVELRMDWPAPLSGRYSLQLVVDGKVQATTTRGTVIHVTRYEYLLS